MTIIIIVIVARDCGQRNATNFSQQTTVAILIIKITTTILTNIIIIIITKDARAKQTLSISYSEQLEQSSSSS